MVVQTIVQLCSSLGIECVAEHVETQVVARRLTELKVDCIQGYLGHRPEPLRDALEAIKAEASQRLQQIYLAQ